MNGRNKNGEFTKGNTCAKGNRGKEKYKKIYIKLLLEHFAAEPAPGVEFPMFEGFAKKIGVTVRTLERWAAEKEDFGEAYERCRDVQRRFLVLGGLTERYNASFAKFMCGVHGMTDKGTSDGDEGGTGGSSGGLDVVITLLKEEESEDAK